MSFFSSRFFRFATAAALIVWMQSCYTVTIANKHGIAEPDPTNQARGFFYLKKVQVIDTVVNLSLLENGVITFERCSEGCFYALEFKATLGGVLLNAITLGKKRLIKVRYICLQPRNE